MLGSFLTHPSNVNCSEKYTDNGSITSFGVYNLKSNVAVKTFDFEGNIIKELNANDVVVAFVSEEKSLDETDKVCYVVVEPKHSG